MSGLASRFQKDSFRKTTRFGLPAIHKSDRVALKMPLRLEISLNPGLLPAVKPL
jgi:hypothetical protein